MQLVTLHKILIGAAMCMCAVFALWAFWMYQHRDSPPHLVGAALGIAVASGLGVYLRYFIRTTRRRTD